MRAGLAASTVTPGSTAPDASRTTPAMLPTAPCARATTGWSKRLNTTTMSLCRPLMFGEGVMDHPPVSGVLVGPAYAVNCSIADSCRAVWNEPMLYQQAFGGRNFLLIG